MSDKDIAGSTTPGGETSAARAGDGVLVYRGQRIGVRGRALKLILWVAGRQQRINETAPVAGQMWMSWKGDGPQSIDGDIKAPL
jgi:hypothetical protein